MDGMEDWDRRLSRYIIYMTESWGWKTEQAHGRVAGMDDWTDVMQCTGHGMEDWTESWIWKIEQMHD